MMRHIRLSVDLAVKLLGARRARREQRRAR